MKIEKKVLPPPPPATYVLTLDAKEIAILYEVGGYAGTVSNAVEAQGLYNKELTVLDIEAFLRTLYYEIRETK